MGRFKIPYLIFRAAPKGRRYYFCPKKDDAAGGFRLTALGMDEEKAKKRALELYEELKAWRKGDASEFHSEGMLGWLCNRYERSPEYARLSPRSKRDYSFYIVILKKWAGKLPISGITRVDARRLYDAYLQTPRKAQYRRSAGKPVRENAP